MYIVMSIIWQLHLYLDYKIIYPHNKCEDKWYHNCKAHFDIVLFWSKSLMVGFTDDSV